MILFLSAIGVGLALLVWSADKFVDGASQVARYFKVSPLLIGMLIIGFGTSAPEMVVSVMSSWQGSPGIALGNAYGSNITNIGLIVGLTALIMPIAVHSQVLKKELPILVGITLLTVVLLYDLSLSTTDAVILMVTFAGLLIWTVWTSVQNKNDAFSTEIEEEIESHKMPVRKSFFLLSIGLLLLVGSSRLLVYGAVGVATKLGVSDIIIGLTVVAIGTSLPELASSIIAARKNEPDIALGNILGSNMFNTLAVVGISGSISPMTIDKQIFSRDILTMVIFTFVLFVFCFGFRKEGLISRVKGGFLLMSYIGYTFYLISSI